MRYFEMNEYCDIAEYRQGEPERLLAGDLYVDEHYVLMAALQNQRSSQKQAAKIPTQLHHVTEVGNGLYQVELSLLDDDLRPYYAVDAVIKNGYWLGVVDKLAFYDDPVKAAYFRGYGDNMDDELRQVAAGLELAKV